MAKITLHGRSGIVGETLVDDKDYAWLNSYRWHLHPKGYATAGISDQNITGRNGQAVVMMQRVILGLRVGDKRQSDHRNGDKLDNRRENLRIVDHSIQMRNRRKSGAFGSRYKGVSLRGGQWVSILFLGSFETEEAAAQAYDDAVREIFPGMPTNFPQGDERAAVAPLHEKQGN
jgi:hypothetical protein